MFKLLILLASILVVIKCESEENVISKILSQEFFAIAQSSRDLAPLQGLCSVTLKFTKNENESCNCGGEEKPIYNSTTDDRFILFGIETKEDIQKAMNARCDCNINTPVFKTLIKQVATGYYVTIMCQKDYLMCDSPLLVSESIPTEQEVSAVMKSSLKPVADYWAGFRRNDWVVYCYEEQFNWSIYSP